MRLVAIVALIIGVILVPTSLGIAKADHDRRVSELERTLVAETDEHGSALASYFDRARSVTLLTANSPPFANVLAEPGTREEKVRRQSRNIKEVTQQLAYLGELYRGSIGEACFIDLQGEELARVVAGEVAPPGELSNEEEKAPFFAPSFKLNFGQVHQTKPYVSPDTKEWVVANATPIPQADGAKRAIAHFEVTIESFRRAMGAGEGEYELRVIDGTTGAVIIDGTRPQRIGQPLGVPGHRHAEESLGGAEKGITEIHGRRAAYRRIEPTVGNANDWVVVASAVAPTGGALSGMGPVPVIMLLVALLTIGLAGASLRASRRELEAHANTDALTSLGNRRKLMADLERRVAIASAEHPLMLTLFDLNGFKNYNDSFGHAAGDALLQRLGHALADTARTFGAEAFRQGGDEFCITAPATEQFALELAAGNALSEQGDGFAISAAFGTVLMPRDTGDVADALRGADEAMYAQKNSGRETVGRRTSDVLIRALEERHPDLLDHHDGIAELAEQVGERLGIEGAALEQLREAASLHDIGKVAIPRAIMAKPAPLTDEELAFVHRHSVIGERILAAAPALDAAARLVRASHEAWDGSGYPDGMAGAEIPLGSRIIAVCDAFRAMTSQRPYAAQRTAGEALAELHRCSGSQFDASIVQVFEQLLAEQAQPPMAPAAV